MLFLVTELEPGFIMHLPTKLQPPPTTHRQGPPKYAQSIDYFQCDMIWLIIVIFSLFYSSISVNQITEYVLKQKIVRQTMHEVSFSLILSLFSPSLVLCLVSLKHYELTYFEARSKIFLCLAIGYLTQEFCSL